MRIELTPLTPTHHRLAITRADGSHESVELETRSLLLHDLVHLAVETEAGLQQGFWGLVAAGHSLASLRLDDPDVTADLVLAESLVGPMQAVWNQRLDANRYAERSRRLRPDLDQDFVERVRGRLRRLWGHWDATRHGDTMAVSWPLD